MIITENIPISRIVRGTWKNLLFSIMTCSLAYLVNEIWLSKYFSFPTIIPTVLGTSLAFFIGFNNNQAYDRWWEARKIWGAIVNNSRTWSRQVLYYAKPSDALGEDELRKIQVRMVKRHVGFLYALKMGLRRTNNMKYKDYLGEEEGNEVSEYTNVHNAILSWQADDLNTLYDKGCIDGFKFRELSGMITTFSDDMGGSERINNTVFPTTYNYYSRAFIWVFVYSVTMSIGNSIGIWAIVFGGLVGYVFFTIQAMGQLVVNPFENHNITGTPLDQIIRTIEINLFEMLGEENIPQPVQSIKGEYVM